MTIFRIILFECGLICLDSIVITDLRKLRFCRMHDHPGGRLGHDLVSDV